MLCKSGNCNWERVFALWNSEMLFCCESLAQRNQHPESTANSTFTVMCIQGKSQTHELTDCSVPKEPWCSLCHGVSHQEERAQQSVRASHWNNSTKCTWREKPQNFGMLWNPELADEMLKWLTAAIIVYAPTTIKHQKCVLIRKKEIGQLWFCYLRNKNISHPASKSSSYPYRTTALEWK